MIIKHCNVSLLKLFSFIFLIGVLSACEKSESETKEDERRSTASIIVNQSSVLLTGISETAQLTAFAVDANDDSIDTPIQWKSNKPNDIAVDEFGVVTSHVVLGSATITAYKGDIESSPVSIIVATFSPGVLTVNENNIVTPPELKDPLKIPSADNPLIVSLLKTSSVELGDKLIASGIDFFGGEVVAIETLATELRVTLAMLPLADLFDHLSVNEVIKLTNLKNQVNPKIAEFYNVKTLSNGSIEFSLKPEAKKRRVQAELAAKADSFNVGVFECLYDVAGSTQPISINFTPDTFVVKHDIDLLFDYDLDTIGLKKLAIDGAFEAGLYYDVKLLAGLEGFVECETELFVIIPTLPSVFELVMPLTIPISVGFRVDAKTDVIVGTVQTSGLMSTSLVMGIECDELACNSLFNADSSSDFSFDYQFSTPVQLTDSFKEEFSFMPYATVGLKFWGFNFSSYRAGLAETHKVGIPVSLIKDELYEAEYYLSTETGFIPGQKHSAVWDGLKYLGLSKHDAEINVEKSLESRIISRSPLGAKVVVNKEGEWDSNPQTNQLQFEISIVPTTENYYQFPTGASLSIDSYNIKEIVIIRVADPSEFSLTTEEIARVEAQPGQTEFTIDAFGEFESVDPAVQYYAFALTQAGITIENSSGIDEAIEYVLIGKVKLSSRIELSNVEFLFSANLFANRTVTACRPVNIFSNFPRFVDEDIDRSNVRHAAYSTTIELSGQASVDLTSSFSINTIEEQTEFRIDVEAELISYPSSSSGQANIWNYVKFDFEVSNGPLNCTLLTTDGGNEYESTIQFIEGENSHVMDVSPLAYAGATINTNIHISLLCDGSLTTLNPTPPSSSDSVLSEQCLVTPPPGGGSGPL